MPRCRLCGKPVPVALVVHGRCWEAEAERIAAQFCRFNCRWFAECNEDELGMHCDGCQMGHLASILQEANGGQSPGRRGGTDEAAEVR